MRWTTLLKVPQFSISSLFSRNPGRRSSSVSLSIGISACILSYLRTLGIAEDRLLRLWHLEKKLLQLLHVDSTGSKTWFLDSCGAITRRDRRLLLTNYDIGIAVPAHALQLGLNFAEKPPELFAGKEMGEDALRVLNDIIPLQAAIRADVAAELPHLRETVKWAARP